MADTTLAQIRTRVRNFLTDSGALIWSNDALDESIRLALRDISSAVAGTQLTLKDLDSASVTTLPARDESCLVQGAAAYCAMARAQERVESANVGQDMPAQLFEWANNRMDAYRQALEEIRRRCLQNSASSPHSELEWEEETEW